VPTLVHTGGVLQSFVVVGVTDDDFVISVVSSRVDNPVVTAPVVDASSVVVTAAVDESLAVDNVVVNSLIVVVSSLVIAVFSAGVVAVDSLEVNSATVVVSC